MKRTFLKNATLLFISFILFGEYALGECRTTIRIGHPTGTYEYVNQDDDGQTLVCKGNGSSDCLWKDGKDHLSFTVNQNPITDIEAGQIVQSNIDNNVLSGQVSGDDGISFYSWSEDMQGNINFTFCGYTDAN